MDPLSAGGELIPANAYTVLLAMACAWSCGLSVWGTVVAIGLVAIFQPWFRPPGGLAVFASAPILWAAAAVYAVEFAVTKFTQTNIAWHRWNARVRVAAGAAIAFLAAGSLPMDVRLMACVLGAVLAFFVHSLRLGAHLAARDAGTGAIAAGIGGLLEDCLVFAMILPLAFRPFVSGMLLGVSAVAAGIILFVAAPQVRRAASEVVFGVRKDRVASRTELPEQ